MGFAECIDIFLKMLFAAFDVFFRNMFRLIYGKTGKKMPAIKDLVLLESATSLAYKIRNGKLSSLDVTNSFIERIHETNKLLNCVVDNRFEDARKEAQAADDLIKSGSVSSESLAKEKPFLGVPFTTKDCIAVKDMLHTSGLYKRKDVKASEDAATIKLLRAAGAIPIALTNVSELCMWWESNNPVHGRTNNPYDSNRIVGGSSGGEGCIQAAAGSAFGIGSDIGGSIRMPCFFNGVFGHKPSKFVVSNEGQFPAAVNREQDSFLGIGPMVRRAEDLTPLLKVIAGKNAESLKLDEPVDLKKIKFFYQDCDTGSSFVSSVDPEIKECFSKIAVHLEKAHKIKAQKMELEKFAQSKDMWLYNMKAGPPGFDMQLGNLEKPINLNSELLKWFAGCSNHTFVALATALLENTGPGNGSETYRKYVLMRDHFRMEMKDMLGDDGVFIYPTHPTPAPYHNEPLFKPFNFSYTGIFNVLTLPATHIPMGLSKSGLPIGVQVVANDKNDRLCLAVARELEKAFGGWVPPQIDA
ncbi:PREDICTED: fatty-acid amide hydrolase 2 [Nicrophorus vespilloides]|uniref:Fatty-acid amide hydrolase 2 n=1 Tax=Nicrophorus vespilloides TaxID=110193 RepID=A0ABM1N9B0_NICVS|nr:PREDICTED: fatty-acid amide hydrolase 2 [Nicrophorus vespilloides]